MYSIIANMASPFRTKEMTDKHEAYKVETREVPGVCALCEKHAILDFEYWKIVENSFPYDLVSSVSNILVPKRHTIESGLNAEEKTEYEKIKKEVLSREYDYVIECMPKEMSIPSHFHVHILIK